VLEKPRDPLTTRTRQAPLMLHACGRSPPPACRARAWQFFVRQSSSSLTRRIIFLNSRASSPLWLGVLYLSAVSRRTDSSSPGKPAGAGRDHRGLRSRPSSTTADPDNTQIDLERLLDCRPGETYKPQDEIQLDFPDRSGRASRRCCAGLGGRRPIPGRASMDRRRHDATGQPHDL